MLASCSATKDLSGNVYTYNSKNRTLQLIFDTESTCRIKNIFHCDDIDQNIKEISMDCKYERIDNKIIIRNVTCKSDSCDYGLIYDIPIQNSVQCDFLNENHRRKENLFGPNYATEYKKHGYVPIIDVDTLFVKDNKIVFYKQNEKESIGYIFKK